MHKELGYNQENQEFIYDQLMQPFHPKPILQQVEEHLEREIEMGTWTRDMPGIATLSENLGVNHKTVQKALVGLEERGLLINQGSGHPRRISPHSAKATTFQIGILLYEKADVHQADLHEMIHRLSLAGHTATPHVRSQTCMAFDVKRIARSINKTSYDAWIIMAGSRDILTWFSKSRYPSFAIFGRREGLPIASVGPESFPQIEEATRKLVALGHRRITWLAHEERRVPEPGKTESLYLKILSELGVQIGPYNLPNWENSPEGLRRCLDSLFALTPPTAIITDDAAMHVAVLQFLMSRKLQVPEDISIICTRTNHVFQWGTQAIAHFHWDSRPVILRVTRWVNSLVNGKPDNRQHLTKSTFVFGDTIQAAKKG